MVRRAKLEGSIDASVLAALGRVVVEYNMIEAALSGGIHLAIQPEETAEIVAAELSTRNRANIVFSILRKYNSDPTLLKELDGLHTAVTDAEATRNRLMHSVWAPSDGQTALTTKTTSKKKLGLHVRQDLRSAPDLDRTAVEFHKLAEALLTLFIRADLRFK